MIPVTFSNCFGYLHPATGSHGIVMCSAIGYEELGTHRSWYELSTKFADSNFPTLRFDYHGVNDSLGSEDDADRVKMWISSVIEAVDFLRTTTGVKKITLVGLRLGATLASIAATCLRDIDHLVLLAPVVTGRGYIRELKLVADVWWNVFLPGVKKLDSDQYLDVIGTRWFKSTLDDLNAIDLRKTTIQPAKQVLILDAGRRSDVSKFVEKLKSLEVQVQTEVFINYNEFMMDSVLSQTPHLAFLTVLEWVKTRTNNIAINEPIETPSPLLKFKYGSEYPVKFGPDQKLLGIITTPLKPSTNNLAVIVLNTGPNHHVGNGRLSVLVARQLAQWGVTTLRFDLSGIGDSESLPDRPGSLYSLEACDDVSAAIQLLESLNKNKNRPIVLLGLCSGAYLALHSALREVKISGAVIVNLQKFIWKEGISLQVGGKNTKRSMKFYLKSVTRRSTWIRVWQGNANLLDTLQVLLKRPARKLQTYYLKVANSSNQNNLSPTREVKKWIDKLNEKDKRVCLWYSEDDPGLIELFQYFGTNAKYLQKFANIQFDVLSQADHSLNHHQSRIEFLEKFKQYLQTEFNITKTS